MKIKVFLDQDIKTRDKCFEFIATESSKLKTILAKDKSKLVEGFIKREEIGTTGFEDGIAIPHAQIDEIIEPAIIIVRSKTKIKWESVDGKPITTAISIQIPKSKVESTHLDALSKVSTLLLDENFRKTLATSKSTKKIEDLIKNAFEDKKDNVHVANKNNDKFIVGVSACATGVAHTYMAKEALEKYGAENGYNVKIETQGQKGQEYKLTDDEIEKADAVLIAADIYVDDERFNGKKLLKVKTNDAISNPGKCLKASLDASIKGGEKSKNKQLPGQSEFKSSKMKTFMGHLLTGVSRMIPFIVFSGIVWAIMNSIGNIPGVEENEVYKVIKAVSEIGFTFFIAIMGGFIAESIAGRSGLAPGMICTFAAANSSFYFWWDLWGEGSGIPQINYFTKLLGVPDSSINNVGLSLFAAIMMGFAAGYLVKWVNTWKTHKLVTPLMPIIFIPVICTSIIAIPFVLLLSGPLGFLMNGLVYGIAYLSKINGVNFLMGFVLGAMIGFDMGGPVNKIAGTTATALIPIDPRLMGAVAAAIPIAPIGCAFATFIGRPLFNEKERAEGITALGLGFFGISEGAIPFATNRPKKVLIANLIGSGLAGGLAFLFYCGGYVGMWGGPITAIVLGEKAPVGNELIGNIPDAFGGAGNGMEYISILWFFVAILAGSLIHATILVCEIGGKAAANKIFHIEQIKAKMNARKAIK